MSHCLNEIEIINPHWDARKPLGVDNLRAWRNENNYSPLTMPDDYKLMVPCGRCLGCRRDKALSWRVRLLHEHHYGNHKNCFLVTLTISDENIGLFATAKGQATAFRNFIDRLRNYHPDRRSPKRFFISELGERTKRLHYHGIIWDFPLNKRILERTWTYGFVDVQPLKSSAGLTYVTKYITKTCGDNHIPKIYVSPGLGKAYTEDPLFRAWHKTPNDDCNINYCVKFDSVTYALPRYYRDKIFTDDEISDFKDILSQPDRPFKKVLGKQTYTDEQSYKKARKALFEGTLRNKKSSPLKRRSKFTPNKSF